MQHTIGGGERCSAHLRGCRGGGTSWSFIQSCAFEYARARDVCAMHLLIVNKASASEQMNYPTPLLGVCMWR